MSRLIFIFAISMLLLTCGCSDDTSFSPTVDDNQVGYIVFKVTWPEKHRTTESAKLSTIETVTSITAYVYAESGTEATHTDLRHEDNRGKAEISVDAANNYLVRLVAFDSSIVQYIGTDNDVDVVSGQLTTADITMNEYFPPTLNSATSTGDNSYSFRWTAKQYATGYVLQEADNESFTSPTAVYSGSDLTVSLTDKSPGQYYYRVCSVTQYGNSTWSETRTVGVDSNGTISIDIPWPEESNINLSVRSPLASTYDYSYVDKTLTVTGEVVNSGSSDATNVSLTLIARNPSGTYMDELTHNIGTVSAERSKGFNVTFSAEVFSGADHPAATCDYTLTCTEGGPFTGSVDVE